MMDLGIARKVAGWSTLRKRGNPIEDSRVEDPEQNAQMESLDHRAYVGGDRQDPRNQMMMRFEAT
jgi:hypothetical protein